MERLEIIDRLLEENPPLFFLVEEDVKSLAAYGVKYQAGPLSMAVAPEVIRYLGEIILEDHLTIETGCGQTTVAFGALAKHHVCVTYPDLRNIELTKKYLEVVGIPRDKVTFVLGSSDTELPKLAPKEKFDVAFIDGCHGYPFPALDWHFIDLHMKVGGIIGFDNTEIRCVQDHCRFLEENKSYRLVKKIFNTSYGGNYGANFYLKEKDEEREWICQPYNQHQPRGNNKKGLHTRLRRKVKRLVSYITWRLNQK